ncbi:MAG: hypothetical protein IJ620_06855 [Bacteroidales bacterium]|nr:hypothetical protein [Bacteroidales bacterium]
MSKQYILTKSKYIRGLQCVKAMYFDVFNSRLAHYDPETLARFRQGREFEASYKATYPNGIAVDALAGKFMDRYPQKTADLLAAPGEVVLFEAGFLYNEVLVLADVVRKNDDGTFDIFEVKNNSQLKDVFRNDAAIQHYVISHCVNAINSFNIVHNDGDEGFVVEDILAECRQQMSEIDTRVESFKALLRQKTEPALSPGAHCDTPYPCPYRWYCEKNNTPFASQPVTEV